MRFWLLCSLELTEKYLHLNRTCLNPENSYIHLQHTRIYTVCHWIGLRASRDIEANIVGLDMVWYLDMVYVYGLDKRSSYVLIKDKNYLDETVLVWYNYSILWQFTIHEWLVSVLESLRVGDVINFIVGILGNITTPTITFSESISNLYQCIYSTTYPLRCVQYSYIAWTECVFGPKESI